MATLRRFLTIGALEAYAILLAFLQLRVGVRTDEAKYLLSIPYPHPPFVRWILSLTDGWAYQEVFWRIVFATVLVQSVWFAVDIGRRQGSRMQWILALSWLLSGGVILWAGTIMLSVVAAVGALLLLWLEGRPHVVRRFPGIVSLLWLISVFSSFQSVLFAPLAWRALWHSGLSRAVSAALVTVPVFLLTLYSFTNPLILATMLIHSTEGAATTWFEHLKGAITLWLLAGSGTVSILGLAGVLLAFDAALIMSFFLVALYVLLSVAYPFYAVLFTPLLVEGVRRLPQMHRMPIPVFTVLCAFGVFLCILPRFPHAIAQPEQTVIHTLLRSGVQGTLAINGGFGHQWQYLSSLPVMRYVPGHLDGVGAVVCLDPCVDLDTSVWNRRSDVPVETWVRL